MVLGRLSRLDARHLPVEESVVRELEGQSKLRIGAIASLETLYKSDSLREKLVGQYPDLLGGEMEAFGFLESGSPWLLVKAVSDSGGDNFSREKQGEAARRAAVVIPAPGDPCMDYVTEGRPGSLR